MQQIAATDVPMKNSCHFMYLRMFVNHADDGVIDRSVLKTDTRIPEIAGAGKPIVFASIALRQFPSN